VTVSPSPEFVALQQAVAGRYSLDRELGRGGMGVVFLARDVALDRLVAIKLLPPALAGTDALRARFLAEARMAAGLAHPHIVPIHAVEEHGDLAFYVMGYVDGETLGERVRARGPLPAGEVMRVVQEVAWALGHAHARGVVHRDVKPDNILLERGTGRALVTDFGIAHATAAVTTPTGGVAMGTPQYMSPEHAAGAPADARSDLYSLGVTAFLALTGRLPFEASSVAGYLAKHAEEPAPPVASVNPRVPLRLATTVGRLLEKEPERRPDSADALAAELAAARDTVVQLPAPVRGFLRDADGAGGEIATALLVGGAALGIHQVFFADDMFAALVFYPVSAVMMGLALARYGQLVLKARDLVQLGYGHTTVRPAALLQARQREEEDTPVDPAATRHVKRRAAFYAAVGAVKTGAFLWLASIDGPIALNFVGAVGAVTIPAFTIRKLWNDLTRGKNLWGRLMAGRFGRFLFRVAGVGARAERPALPAAGEPTSVVLGHAVEELYGALPAAERRRLSEVPEVVARLQSDIAALRDRADEPGAGERLETAVAALEAIRLDLLRLHAGIGTREELTRDIETARRVGEGVDAVLGEV
jgi:serine/threonine-protein kinase